MTTNILDTLGIRFQFQEFFQFHEHFWLVWMPGFEVPACVASADHLMAVAADDVQVPIQWYKSKVEISKEMMKLSKSKDSSVTAQERNVVVENLL